MDKNTPTTKPTESVDLDLNKLEALARAATPGEWKVERLTGGGHHNVGIRVRGPVVSGYAAALNTRWANEAQAVEQEANAAYIAAANPATLLALIALARRAPARQEADEREQIDPFAGLAVFGMAKIAMGRPDHYHGEFIRLSDARIALDYQARATQSAPGADRASVSWKMANWLSGLSVSELMPDAWRATCAELAAAWQAAPVSAPGDERAVLEACPLCEEGHLLRMHFCNKCGVEMGTAADAKHNATAPAAQAVDPRAGIPKRAWSKEAEMTESWIAALAVEPAGQRAVGEDEAASVRAALSAIPSEQRIGMIQGAGQAAAGPVAWAYERRVDDGERWEHRVPIAEPCTSAWNRNVRALTFVAAPTVAAAGPVEPSQEGLEEALACALVEHTNISTDGIDEYVPRIIGMLPRDALPFDIVPTEGTDPAHYAAPTVAAAGPVECKQCEQLKHHVDQLISETNAMRDAAKVKAVAAAGPVASSIDTPEFHKLLREYAEALANVVLSQPETAAKEFNACKRLITHIDAKLAAAAGDAARLDFLIEREAWIAFSKDGERCRMFHRDEDGDGEPIMGWGHPNAWHADPREAIDAAIAAMASPVGAGDKGGA